MKKYLLISVLFSLTLENKAQIISDADGNNYNPVTIGTQTWIKENLKTTKYNDGSIIPYITDSSAWHTLITPGYCWYNNDTITCKPTYGGLYNWYAVNTSKLCPLGWHVPSKDEWKVLFDFLGGGGVAGGKLKEAGLSHWADPNTGADNSSEFTALPGGWRDGYLSSSPFLDLGEIGFWWSTTEKSGGPYAWNCFMSYINSAVYWTNDHYDDKVNGNSVRCIKDITVSIENDITSEEIIFYPNPTTDKLYIKNSKTSNTLIIIYDMQGCQLVNKRIDSNPINISNLSKGVYLIKFVDSGNITVAKLIKE